MGEEGLAGVGQEVAHVGVGSGESVSDTSCVVSEDPVLTEGDIIAEYFPQDLHYSGDDTLDNSPDTETLADNPDTEDSNVSTEVSIEKQAVEKPLFEGCPLTLAASNTLVMKFKMRHGLTKGALSDLLKLIKLHCPVPNSCCRSLYYFNKLFMENLKQPARFHLFCSSCYTEVETHTACPNIACGMKISDQDHSKSHFIELPLDSQLASILESKYPCIIATLYNYYIAHRKRLL